MGKEALKIFNLFRGGLSDSRYQNSPYKAPYMVGLDLRTEIGVIQANQNMKPLVTGTTPDKHTNRMLYCTNGITYYFSNESGKIWELSAANSWSLTYTTVPVYGDANILDAFEYSGYLYWSTQNYLHRIRINRTADWATYAEPNWKRLTLDQPVLGFDTDDIGYAIPTSIVEIPSCYREFTPIENELSGISVRLNTLSSANITVTVHDPSNSVIGNAVTILNANLVAGELNFFKFTAPAAVDPDVTYHYHVTGSALGAYSGIEVALLGTVTMSAASPCVVNYTGHGLVAGDEVYFTTSGGLPTGLAINTVYYVIAAGLTANAFELSATRGGAAINTSSTQSGTHKLHAPSMSNAETEVYTKSTNTFHPFADANGVMYLGDRYYIHQVEDDPTTGEHVFSYFALDVPKHFVISVIEGYNTSLIIGTFSTNDVNRCSVFWWNTYSTVSYSYEDEVEEAGIFAFLKMDDTLFCSAGVNGNIYQYIDGRLQFYRQIPGLYSNLNKGHVNANACVWFRNAMHFGFAATDGTPAPGGMYSLFSPLPNYPYVFNIEYAISARSNGDPVTAQVEIMAAVVRGQDLMIAWWRHDTDEMGVDIIDWDNKHDRAQFKTGVIKSASDLSQFTLKKLAVDYAELPTDTSIDIQYCRNFSDTVSDPGSLTDSLKLQQVLNTADVLTAVEGIVKLESSGNTSPKIFGLYFELE